MFINTDNTGNLNLPLTPEQVDNSSSSQAKGDKFTDTLSDFINNVNSAQKESVDLSTRFIKGEPVEIHDVMIASEKAKTTFQLLLELRNKFIDMYHELDRLQI